MTQDIMEATEELQKQMHQTTEWIMSNSKKVSYQDAVNVFLLFKISELQERLKEIRQFLVM